MSVITTTVLPFSLLTFAGPFRWFWEKEPNTAPPSGHSCGSRLSAASCRCLQCEFSGGSSRRIPAFSGSTSGFLSFSVGGIRLTQVVFSVSTQAKLGRSDRSLPTGSFPASPVRLEGCRSVSRLVLNGGKMFNAAGAGICSSILIADPGFQDGPFGPHMPVVLHIPHGVLAHTHVQLER